MKSTSYYSAKTLVNIRSKISTGCPNSPEYEEWSKSKVDPMDILGTFSGLKLKQGYVLRAYQFCALGNGNGVVWAVPEDSPFLPAESCPKLEDAFLSPPRPPLALDDLMEVIEGDGFPWSYLAAYVFKREMAEFGASWHGCNWSTHEIIGQAPYDYFGQIRGDSDTRSCSKVDDWTWLEEEPMQWQPSVCMKNTTVVVTLYTFSGLIEETIFRHVTTFEAGKYTFKTKEVAIAWGVEGYIF